MIQLFNVNPFAEAMLYYFGRANNKKLKKNLADVIRRSPTQKDALERLSESAIALERRLDSELNVDNELVNKFFKAFDSDELSTISIPFDFCLASVMMQNVLMNNIEYSTEEICRRLKECSFESRMYSFCFGIADRNEAVYLDKSGASEFAHRLERLPLEDKWKIQSAALNYIEHIDELLSLIIPAAEIIKNSENEYRNIIDEFKMMYSSDNAQSLLMSSFKLKSEPADTIKIAPMILGFDRIAGTKRVINDITADRSDASAPSSVLMAFIGIARHIISRSPQDEILVLSEGMKALSDSTRLEILFYLCSHTAYGQELCAKFGLVRSALSYHITKLMDAGFVIGELTGSKTFYTADKAGIRRMLEAFEKKIK